MHLRSLAALAASFLAGGAALADDYDTVRAALEAGDYETAYATLAAKGDEGDTLAMTMLADLQLAEVTGPPNLGLAIAWLEQAADRGSVHAKLRLGAIYQRLGPLIFPTRDGIPMAVALPEQSYWFENAVDDGSEVALSRLATVYYLGLHSMGDGGMTQEEERERAVALFERAAEAGQTDAMFRLSMALRRDDPERAAELLLAAALGGEQEAIGVLAGKPEMGGITDPVDAVAWAMAAKFAWTLDENPRSPLFNMSGARSAAEFSVAMDEIIEAATADVRAAAEIRADEITSGWESLLPDRSG